METKIFQSFAQNFEDIMLHRALGHIPNGFYVDVGAENPVHGSVTKAFYDAGWRGINIEPASRWFMLLKEARPEDINLNLGIAAKRGKVPFWEVRDAGFSTFDPALGAQYEGRNRHVDRAMIDVIPLTDVIEEHRRKGEIHFLKIDVEGFEEEVIRSMDFKRFRPWIVLAEATAPSERRQTHHSWDPLLCEADYEFVYFDGLNRFYLAKEHLDLKPAFDAPPNVFDNFRVPAFLASSHRPEIEKLRNENHRLRRVESHYQDMQKSLSWKVTAPLRWIRDRFSNG